MYKEEQGYLDLLREIMYKGEDVPDRTGTGTRRVFCPQVQYNLKNGTLPVFTTKKIHLPSVIHELIWFISGDTNTKYLKDNNIRIWDEWADKDGNLGPVYGFQWRNVPKLHYTDAFGLDVIGYVDQIIEIERQLKTDPTSRRIILNAWNPSMLHQMALPPCHCFVQFFVTTEGYLNCMLYQRSADMFLGVPFNVTSYSILTHMLARVTGLKAGTLFHNMGDAHIYSNHFPQVEEQISRECKTFPVISLPTLPSITRYKYQDIDVLNYNHHPLIKGKVAV